MGKREKISRVYLMCGPAGSGKSTFARKLEAGGAVRLSFDEESFKRGIFKHPLPDEIREAVKQELDARLLELIKSGQDVVLDYSFWSKEMRKEYTDLLKSNGIHPIIYYVECPKESPWNGYKRGRAYTAAISCCRPRQPQYIMTIFKSRKNMKGISSE